MSQSNRVYGFNNPKSKDVILHIYDLSEEYNEYLYAIGLGLFHTGVVFG
jgi:hypothetical protein